MGSKARKVSKNSPKRTHLRKNTQKRDIWGKTPKTEHLIKKEENWEVGTFSTKPK
jgi:hypothetical protein